jgi:hypothetical protein
MDNVMINIDELVLDGTGPVDEAAIAAALRERSVAAVSENLSSEAVKEVAASVVASLRG